MSARSILLTEKISDMEVLIGTIGNIINMLANTLACHFIIAWVGSKYVEARISSTFHQTILGSMDSGVIIISKDSYGVKFYNEAADIINSSLQGKSPSEIDSSATSVTSNMKSEIGRYFDLSGKNLATVDESLLYEPGIPSSRIIDAYKAHQDYISILDIIYEF